MSREALLDMAVSLWNKTCVTLFILYEVLTSQVSRKKQVQMYENLYRIFQLPEMRSDFDEKSLL